MTPQERAAQRTAGPAQQPRTTTTSAAQQRLAQQRAAQAQQRSAQQRAAAQTPTQRSAQQRAAAQTPTQQRLAQQRAAQLQAQQRRAQLGAASPARTTTGRTTSRQGTDDFATLMQRNTVDVSAAGTRRRSPVVGKIALVLAVVCAAVDASAFALFMGGAQQVAFGICFVVVFLTFVAAVMGFVAAVGSLGRWYGVVGVVVAFFANPVVLIVLVVFVAPEVLNTMAS